MVSVLNRTALCFTEQLCASQYSSVLHIYLSAGLSTSVLVVVRSEIVGMV